MSKQQVISTLKRLADPERAAHSQRFFKTGKGQYGEGDRFLGIRVPEQRKVANQFRHLSLEELACLIHNPYHEIRLTTLIILVERFKRANQTERKEIVDLYLANTQTINNWDLVDTSAPYILGEYFFSQPRTVLDELVHSRSLWERRMAIMASFYFIRQHDFSDTLKWSEQLLNDKEDLIHKAEGWMLREIGNRDKDTLYRFLDKFSQEIPRTMLRYAIEKLPKKRRQAYLRPSN